MARNPKKTEQETVDKPSAGGWKKRRDAAARRRNTLKGGKSAEERAEIARIRAEAANPPKDNETGQTANKAAQARPSKAAGEPTPQKAPTVPQTPAEGVSGGDTAKASPAKPAPKQKKG